MTDSRGGARGLEQWFGLSRNELAVLAAVVVVVGVALGLVAFGLFGGRDAAAPSAGGPPASAPSAADRAATPEPDPPCTDPPQVESTGLDLTQAGLVVSAEFSTSCPDGAVLTGPSARVSVAVGSRDVASGSFDLDSSPIDLPAGGGAVSRDLVYPLRAYWRIPELAAGESIDVQLTNVRIGEGSSGRSSAGATALTALAPAPPGHGSAEVTADNALNEISAYDYPFVKRSLESWWVPQVSSKKLGLRADGIVYDSAEILFDHLERRQRTGDVRLLWSGQWTTFDRPAEFWVTVADEPYSSPDLANSWCDARGIGVDDCFAKYLSTFYGPEGTTRLRGSR